MKPTTKGVNGTSFHDSVIIASVNDLKQICGEPAFEQNDGRDKVNFEWEMETEAGEVFTIYDWKEYRRISEDEEIEWHIGGHDFDTTYEAQIELENALSTLESPL